MSPSPQATANERSVSEDMPREADTKSKVHKNYDVVLSLETTITFTSYLL
jgi:hypothetical protein